MTWVDFKALREKLNFADVLRHYGVELKVRRGEQHQGFCPLPAHKGHRRSPSFSANLRKGIFHCFSCGKKGDCIAFTAAMQGLDPSDPRDIRKAALYLQETFGMSGDPPPAARAQKPSPCPNSEEPAAQQNAGRAATRPAIVVNNAPLNFSLQGLEASHPYLKERGFTAETVAHFGLGYCSRGLMQGRIAIPLHDRHGRLVGYAGRLADDTAVDEEHPKYLFPPVREREGKEYRFCKKLLLYNGFQIGSPVPDLIVVEGFASVWWLWQAGFPNVVALMGAGCSGRQAALILRATRPGGRVWVFPDGDEAGRRCAESVLVRTAPYRFVHWIRLAGGEQPTDLAADDLRDLLEPTDGEEGGTNGRH